MTDIKEIRKAVADYISSEGCGCCTGSDHLLHKARLAKLLKVPMYADKSGYDFYKFTTKWADGDGARFPSALIGIGVDIPKGLKGTILEVKPNSPHD